MATTVAFAVGLASIHWFVGFIARSQTYSFVIYRMAAAAAILALPGCRMLPAI